jgi:hypothetical protein
VGDGERLARACGPQQGDVFLTRLYAVDELFDRLRLVAGRTELGHDLEGRHGPPV